MVRVFFFRILLYFAIHFTFAWFGLNSGVRTCGNGYSKWMCHNTATIVRTSKWQMVKEIGHERKEGDSGTTLLAF